MPAIKIVVIVLFVLLVISLLSSLTFLVKDQETTERRRAWWALSIRLGLALMLVSTLVYGVMTGQLGSKAPWDAYKAGATPSQSSSPYVPAPEPKLPKDAAAQQEKSETP